MFALLLFQVSSLLQPLYLGAEPPELRSARHFVLAHAGAANAPASTTRTREAALERARELVQRTRGGVDFARTISEVSEAANARTGGVLGSFAPGMLAPDVDRFLFSSELLAISDPIALEDGVHVFQRIETRAAVLELRIAGAEDDAEAKARIERLSGELARGADFEALAREHSIDPATAARGGRFAIFERGPRDALLKRAAFELAIGATSPPIHSPLGWHLLKRVPVEGFDPTLAENHWVRVRAILVQHDKVPGIDRANARDQGAAKAIADALLDRIRKGADFAELARKHNEDADGKERAGDLGWIHRGMPDLPKPFVTVFAMKPGDAQVFDSTLGFVVVQRYGVR